MARTFTQKTKWKAKESPKDMQPQGTKEGSGLVPEGSSLKIQKQKAKHPRVLLLGEIPQKYT
jgi:hypothetical protein